MKKQQFFVNAAIILIFLALINYSFTLKASIHIEWSDCQALLQAVKSNQVNQVKNYLKVTNPDCTYYGNGEPRSPLVAAARNGNLEIATLLIKAGASLEFHAQRDENPLMAASRNGHLELVNYFIQQGADVNAEIEGDGTPLICATRGGHYEVSKVLLENGADPYQVSAKDEYAMYHARMSGNTRMINLLKQYTSKK